MANEPNTGAPYIDEAQAQKAATHNAALNILGALTQLAVQNRVTTAPPGGPALGQAWIVAGVATGAWAGQEGKVAAWYGGWVFLTPLEGWLAYDRGADEFVKYTGAAWVVVSKIMAGWTTPTGTLARGAFDAATATLADTAQHLAALITDLKASGRLSA